MFKIKEGEKMTWGELIKLIFKGGCCIFMLIVGIAIVQFVNSFKAMVGG